MKDRKINIDITDVSGKLMNFQSLRSFLEFLESEAGFWKEQKQTVQSVREVNHPHLDVSGSLLHGATTIRSWEENIDDWEDEEVNRQILNLQQNAFQRLRQQWLWSGQPFVEPFVHCLKDQGLNTGTAFLDFTLRNQVQNITNIEHFKGYMYAYEFASQDSNIVKRRNGEKTSLGLLRNQFADAKDNLFKEVSEVQANIASWDADNRTQSTRLFEIQKYLGRRQLKSQLKLFDSSMSEWAENIKNLEKTYEETLKLKKPAEYWAKSAFKYGVQGGLWIIAIVALVVVAAINFQEIFVTWLQGRETPIQLNTIQGVILYGSLAGVYIFLLKVLSRLAFSSFHLMRDSEEREQLTYLYLSLTNESEVDKESRDIVLQALFSRSETGLLSQDHGPTMPGASEAVRSMLRSRGG